MKTVHKVMRTLAPLLPTSLKETIRGVVPMKAYDYARQREVVLDQGPPQMTVPGSRYRFGIVDDLYQDHQYFMAACRDRGVSYEVVDLLADDWVDRFRNGTFDAVLVWPSSVTTVIKQTYDYRLRILEQDLGVCLYPTWQECWLTEHKPRLRDWMDAHGVPHPRTWVFHDEAQALDFARGASLPIICKTATGAGASGVSVIRHRRALERIVRESFGPGLRPKRYDAHDRQRGFVYLQEYLPDVDEWRMVRIGDSFFGYRKEKGADGLHSASHKWSWVDPGKELLDLLKQVTDIGGFTSMNVDVFLTKDGRLLVNELQTVFGCTTPAIYMKVKDVEGRYHWQDGAWCFEPGNYWHNHMCNLRIDHLVRTLDARRVDRGSLVL